VLETGIDGRAEVVVHFESRCMFAGGDSVKHTFCDFTLLKRKQVRSSFRVTCVDRNITEVITVSLLRIHTMV
jgi:hypothetical protein